MRSISVDLGCLLVVLRHSRRRASGIRLQARNSEPISEKRLLQSFVDREHADSENLIG